MSDNKTIIHTVYGKSQALEITQNEKEIDYNQEAELLYNILLELPHATFTKLQNLINSDHIPENV
jgi:plasmid rolling circle replication initiator protein Rep